MNSAAAYKHLQRPGTGFPSLYLLAHWSTNRTQQQVGSAGSSHLQRFRIEKKWATSSDAFIIGLPTPDLSEYSSSVMLCAPPMPCYNCLPQGITHLCICSRKINDLGRSVLLGTEQMVLATEKNSNTWFQILRQQIPCPQSHGSLFSPDNGPFIQTSAI